MVSVSKLVVDVASVMGEREETVRAYARALIDDGLLPKSRGRAIADVESVHIVRLFIAVAVAPKIKDTVSTVETYGNLLKGGAPESAPDRFKIRLEDRLTDMFDLMQSSEVSDVRRQVLDSEIKFVQTWPECEVSLPKFGDCAAEITRFQPVNQHSGLWRGYFMRSAVVSGRAFAFLHMASRWQRMSESFVEIPELTADEE